MVAISRRSDRFWTPSSLHATVAGTSIISCLKLKLAETAGRVISRHAELVDEPYVTVTAHIGQADMPKDAQKRILDGRLWMFLHAGDMLSALQRIAMGADNPHEEAQYIVRLVEDVDSYDPSKPQDRPPKVRNQ